MEPPAGIETGDLPNANYPVFHPLWCLLPTRITTAKRP